jgi:hypothetical protein
MTWLLLNLLLAAPFFAIWVGVPLWLVLKHPDQDHQPQAASTRPAQTGRAGNRAAPEYSNAIDRGRLHQTATGH